MFAPAVKKLSRIDVASQHVTCKTEMNALLPKQFFKMFSQPDSLVADFMCGSGSAVVAAACCGRNCLVVDQDQDMVCIFSISS